MSKFDRPIPVKAGYTYKTEIERIGKEGDGIAIIDGFIVIVPDTNIGDVVKIMIIRVVKRCAFATVVEWFEDEDDVEE